MLKILPKSNIFLKLAILLVWLLSIVYGHYFLDSATASGTRLLDLHPGASAAYSLRKLDSSYAGSAVRIRRDIDDTEQDIGFDAAGNLDLSAIRTFLNEENTLPVDIATPRAAYALRRVNSGYSGPLVRVRRTPDQAEMDIGFDSNGDLDAAALEAFVSLPSAGSLPLDIAPAVGAYGLRQLGSSYAGPLIRVRRSSDSNEQDIGFDLNGDLDLTALDTFCAATNCFIATWYDQSASLHDITQASAANQPKIYDSLTGVTKDSNNSNSIFFNGSNNYLRRTDALAFTGNPDMSIFTVVNYSDLTIEDPRRVFQLGDSGSSNAGNMYSVDFSNLDANPADGQMDGISARYNNGNKNVGGFTIDTVLLSNILKSGQTYAQIGNSPDFYLSGALLSRIAQTNSSFSFNLQNDEFIVGAGRNNLAALVDHWSGYISEFIIYASDQSANRSLIETNIVAYHNLVKAHVVTWYDQSGNSNDLSQTDLAKQPKIYSGSEGILKTENGSYAIRFDGYEDHLLRNDALGLTGNPDISIISVVDKWMTRVNDAGRFIHLGDNVTATDKVIAIDIVNADFSVVDGQPDGISARYNGGNKNMGNHTLDPIILSFLKRAGDTYGQIGNSPDFYLNQIQLSRLNSSDPNDQINLSDHELLIGCGRGNALNISDSWLGYISEIIIYDTDQSANRFRIENNMNKYHDIFSNDAYIRTWYDQSGNSNHAQQTVAADQAQIYDTNQGVIFDSQNNPALRFNQGDFLDMGSLLSTKSVFSFLEPTDTAANHQENALLGGTGLDQDYFAVSDSHISSQVQSPSPNFQSSVLMNDSAAVYALTFTNAQAQIYFQNALFDSLSGAAQQNDFQYIGRKDTSLTPVNYFDGFVSELLLYPDDRSVEAAEIALDINENFNHNYSSTAPVVADLGNFKKFSKRVAINIRRHVLKLDLNENNFIDYSDLIRNMSNLKKAQVLDQQQLSIEELEQVDIDDNHSFNQEDEQIIREGLATNPNFEYVEALFNNIQTNPRGEVNLKAAKKFIHQFKQKRRQFERLEAKALADNLPDSVSRFDCNEDLVIDRNDKICAIDFIREALKQNYSEKRVKRFLRKRKFSVI